MRNVAPTIETATALPEVPVITEAAGIADGLEQLFQQYKHPHSNLLPTQFQLACPTFSPLQAELYWLPHSQKYGLARYIDLIQHVSLLLRSRSYTQAWNTLVNRLPTNAFLLSRAVDTSFELPFWNRSKYTSRENGSHAKVTPTPMTLTKEYRLVHSQGIVTLFRQFDLNFSGDENFLIFVERFGHTDSCKLSYWGSGVIPSRKKGQTTLHALNGDPTVVTQAQEILTRAIIDAPPPGTAT